MACRVSTNPISVQRPRPVLGFYSSPQLPFKFPAQLQLGSRRFRSIACQPDPTLPGSSPITEKPLAEPDSVNDNPSQVTTTSASASLPELPNKDVNRRVALFSTIGALGLFLSTRLDFGVSLKDLTALALPFEEALSNGKPTVVEFYADWCEVCRELAPDVYKVEQQYKDRVNFVMLNVDNTKWEQELDEFGVEGIPHFAFLDKKGDEEGNVVGRLPRQYLLENVDALARGEESIPHARVVGQFTRAEERKVHPVSDPRSHG